jgi:hypothetical protein
VRFLPELVPGLVNENIFQRRLGDGDSFNLAGKRFDQVGDEAVPLRAFQTHLAVDDVDVVAEAGLNLGAKALGLASFEHNHVAADAALQSLGRAEGDELPAVENGEPVATFGFVHEVGGKANGNAVLVAQLVEVGAEVAAHAGIETAGGFVEQQEARPVQQALGNLYAAPQAAGERLNPIVAAVGDAEAVENLCHAFHQRRAAQSVEMALVAQVFGDSQLESLGD